MQSVSDYTDTNQIKFIEGQTGSKALQKAHAALKRNFHWK